MSTWKLKYQKTRDALNKANSIISKVKQLETDQMPISAETEIKRLIPDPSGLGSKNTYKNSLLGTTGVSR